MGQCQCKKGALMERNLDTDAGKEDNLVLHDDEIKKQKKRHSWKNTSIAKKHR